MFTSRSSSGCSCLLGPLLGLGLSMAGTFQTLPWWGNGVYLMWKEYGPQSIIFCFVLVKMWWIKTTPDLLLGDVEVRRLVHLKILGDYGSKGENAKTLTKQKERNWPDQAFRPSIYQVGPGYTDKISNNVNSETWLSLINPCSKDNIISKKQDQNVYGL